MRQPTIIAPNLTFGPMVCEVLHPCRFGRTI
jgi:hypothetical protein